MLWSGCPSEDVAADGEVGKVEAGAAPLPRPASLHSVGFIKDHMARSVGDPVCNVIVMTSEPLVVDEENLGSARNAFGETFNRRWRAKTGIGFGDPCVEGGQWGHDKEPVNAPPSALGLITGVGDCRFARAGHGKVGSMG